MANAGRQRVSKPQELHGHLGHINCLKFGSFSGQKLATGGDDRKVLIWKLDSSAPQRVLSGHASSVDSLEFNPSEDLIAAGASSGSVKLWDLADGKVTRTLTGHRASTGALHFLPGQPVLASGSQDGSARIWDLRQRECMHTLRGHVKGVSAVQFSPDGRWLATGGYEGALLVWDVVSGKKVLELSHRAHDDKILSLFFHPQELLMASASLDKSCKLWDLETNELVATFQDGKTIHSAAFSYDGRALFSSYPDTVKVWGWEPTRCYDIVSTSMSPGSTGSGPLGTVGPASDLCASEDNLQLLGGSLGDGSVSIWAVDLLRVEPFGRNDVDEKEKNRSPGGGVSSSPGTAKPRPSTAPNLVRKLLPELSAAPTTLASMKSLVETEKARRMSVPDSAAPLMKTPGLRNVQLPQAANTKDADAIVTTGPAVSEKTRPVQKAELATPPEAREPSSPRSREALPDSLPVSAEKRRGSAVGERMGVRSAQSSASSCSGSVTSDGDSTTALQARSSAAGADTMGPRGAMSPQPKKGRSTTPRFLEPTAASRQRVLAKTAEAPTSSARQGRESRENRVWVGTTGPVLRPQVERRASEGARRSTTRHSSGESPARGQRRAAGRKGHGPVSPRLQGQGALEGADDRAGRSGGAPAAAGMSRRTAGAASVGPSKQQWIPAVVLLHKRQATPEYRVATRRSQGSSSDETSGLAGAISSSSSKPGALLPSVLGQTAWTVPWASGSSEGSARCSLESCEPPWQTVHDSVEITRVQQAQCGPPSSTVKTTEQAHHPAQVVLPEFPGQEVSAANQPVQCSDPLGLADPNISQIVDHKPGPEPTTEPRGSGAVGSPVTEATVEQTTLSLQPGAHPLLPEPSKSSSPDQQLPVVAPSTADCKSEPSSTVSVGTIQSLLGLSKLSLPSPAGPAVHHEKGQTPGAGPHTPVAPLQTDGGVEPSSRELSPLDPNRAVTPVSPLSSSEGLASEAANGAAHSFQGPARGRHQMHESGSRAKAEISASSTRVRRSDARGANRHFTAGTVSSSLRSVSPNSRQPGEHSARASMPNVMKPSSERGPDLHRASPGSGTYEQASLDLAAFAAECHVPEDGPEGTLGRGCSSEGSIDQDSALREVKQHHRTVLQALSARRDRVQAAKVFWVGDDVPAMLKLLASHRDPSVLVDILGAMVTSGSDMSSTTRTSLRGAVGNQKSAKRWMSLGLSGCADFLPLLQDLLHSQHSSHVDRALLALQDILSCYGDTLHDIQSMTFCPGVDIHAEERRAHSQRCVAVLRTVEASLLEMMRKHHGARGGLMQRVHSRLQDIFTLR